MRTAPLIATGLVLAALLAVGAAWITGRRRSAEAPVPAEPAPPARPPLDATAVGLRAERPDQPLAGFEPRRFDLGKARRVEVRLPGEVVEGRYWSGGSGSRALVLLLADDLRALDWLPVVNALGETMAVDVGAIDGVDRRGGARRGDLHATLARFRSLTAAEQTVIIAFGEPFQRLLAELADEDGLIVIGVSPRLSEGDAQAAWSRPSLPWSLMLIASREDARARAVMEGRRPRTMIPRSLRVPGGRTGFELFMEPRVMASVRGWLFGLLGGLGGGR